MKRIVVCADGTWDVPDRKDGDVVVPTNIAKLAQVISRQDAEGVSEVVRYQSGVGTGRWDRIRGGAFGRGLSGHVKQAYRSIVQVYEPGDEIFLFGFSRGAFTVRSTAGLIRNSGVLTREHLDKVDDAYSLYRSRASENHPRHIAAELFRRQFSHEPRIAFMGVMDTVGALGIPEVPWLPLRFDWINRRWAFHDTELSTTVDRAYQALAIDEQRAQFKPTLWKQQDDAPAEQVMEQVWFAGVHTNIGGGYRDHGLSDIVLLWMKEKAEARGLAFDEDFLERLACQPDYRGVIRDSRTGLYKLPFLPGPYERPIGSEARGNESIHPSVLQRREAGLEPAYAPANVGRYLDAHGDRQADGEATVTPISAAVPGFLEDLEDVPDRPAS